MGRELAITLSGEQLVQLEALASARNESAETLVKQALQLFLDDDADCRAALQEGRDAIESGDVHEFQDVARDMRAYIEQRIANSGK